MSDLNFSLALKKRAEEARKSGTRAGENSALTRRIYDHVASIYPASTFFFHSRAHVRALEHSGIRDGMRVLEVATGSGEMFRRLIRANPGGKTFGLDLSPNMAARTQQRARAEFPTSQAHCGAVDVRHMPFQDSSFDAVVCCYLFELLREEDIRLTLGEIRRVLRAGGSFSLVVIGENGPFFNRLYRLAGGLVPAFWGRQVERTAPEMIEQAGMKIVKTEPVRQSGYPSRVLIARR